MGCGKIMFVFTAVMNCMIKWRVGKGLLGVIQEGGSEMQNISAKHCVIRKSAAHS